MILARLRALPRTEIAILALAIFALAVLSVLTKNAQAPTPMASYSSYDADTGGTRALYELLGKEGVREDRFERRAVFLDRSLQTLVWIKPLEFDPSERPPSLAELKALEAWVKAGGALLYIGHDPLEANLEVFTLPIATRRELPDAAAFVDPSLAAYGIRAISAGSGYRFVHTAKRRPAGEPPGMRVLVADSQGPLVVRYPYGHGIVTAVADQDLFSNAGIAVGDRARLAYALATAHPGTLAFEETTHGYFVPEHWWQVAPRPLVIAVAISLAVLAIGLIGGAVRLGPPVLPTVRDDATTSDFIAALAGLLQKGLARRDAMAAAADSTTRAMARSFGLAATATEADVSARIERDDLRVQYSQMLAIAHNGYPDDRNLVRGVALAQHLRKEYAAHVDRRR